ncbi:MAG: ATP/GTP-binding protein, partial [Nitrososphaerales archaeon]
MYAIFVTGTAGSGKSLLTSRLVEWYASNGAYAAALNLDPGATSLPYQPEVDVRDYVDLKMIMESYALGPNGALIMASDMIGTKLDEIQGEVDSVNPDYVIVDTPGQLELFAYRASGPFFVSGLRCDERAALFLFDGTIVSSPTNFVSISLLATSIRLRLKAPQVNVLSKNDLMQERVGSVLSWASSTAMLEEAVVRAKDSETYLLSMGLLKSAARRG